MLKLIEDVRTARRNDPAARSALEILLCYPGLHAIWFHRLSHRLWVWGLPVVPRFISHIARFLTGVEIHPGATLARRVFIDHGMGVVIGETTIIGEDCLIYQGVTLGGTSLERKKRHPTLEHHVVVGSGAKVLGNITLGHHCRVGSGSVVIKPAPPYSTIVGIPGRIVEEMPDEDRAGHELEHNRMPDVTAKAISALHEQLAELSRELAELRHKPVLPSLPPGTTSEEIERVFVTISASAVDATSKAQSFDHGAGI